MVLTYYGLTCFKVQSGEDVLAIDPHGKKSGMTPPRFEAHVVLFSSPDYARDHSIAGSPLVFSTPGEYEARNISIVGFETPEGTVFFIDWEGLRLLHLGDVTKVASLEAMLEELDTIDILMISSAGPNSEIKKIMEDIDPRIVIPTQGAAGKKISLDAFGGKPEKMYRLTIKKKGLPTEGRMLAVLSSP